MIVVEDIQKSKAEHALARRPKIEQVDNWLSCSACGNKLINVVVNRPGWECETKVKANCPFCEDHSRPSTIKGGFLFELPEKVIMINHNIVDGVLVINLVLDKEV